MHSNQQSVTRANLHSRHVGAWWSSRALGSTVVMVSKRSAKTPYVQSLDGGAGASSAPMMRPIAWAIFEPPRPDGSIGLA
jgi:hypothetical protein